METTESETGLLSKSFARLVATEMIAILDERRAERAEQARVAQWEQFHSSGDREKFEEALRLSAAREEKRLARLSAATSDSEVS